MLEAPVSSITQTASGVLLQTPKGVYSATRAIVAMAPPMTGRIAFYPKMPIARDQFAQHTPMGCAMKAFAVYPTPFWRQAGLSGMSTATTGPIVGTFDNTPPSGTPGVLYGLVDSNTYLQWGLRPEVERKAAILDMLGTFFGPQAKTPTKYFEFDWSAQPWIRGGATIGAVPGTWTSFGSAWRSDWPHPLGIHRNFVDLQRGHGWCHPLRRASCWRDLPVRLSGARHARATVAAVTESAPLDSARGDHDVCEAVDAGQILGQLGRKPTTSGQRRRCHVGHLDLVSVLPHQHLQR